MSFQKIIIEGNLGKDPRYNQFNDGNAVADFTVAVSEKGYTTRSGQEVPERTEWFNVVVKGNSANAVRDFAHKGERILVEGKMRTREYQDQQGVARRVTELVADNVVFLSNKPQQGQGQPVSNPQPQYQSQGAYIQGGYQGQPQYHSQGGGYQQQQQQGYFNQDSQNPPF